MEDLGATTFRNRKIPTHIEGFDGITGGGLPAGRTTLVEGGAGAGKTIFALQTLVNGARNDNEAGVFVAFEETAHRITANAAQFGWDLEALQERKLFILNAQPASDLVVSGEFDLAGLLAILKAKVEEIGAKRIVFDAIDIVLSLLSDQASVMREVYRLRDWLLEHELTAIITGKKFDFGPYVREAPNMEMLQFMVDCAVTLRHEFVQGVSQRTLRVVKYRGSSFHENDSPFFIGDGGIEVAASNRDFASDKPHATSERVSTGVARLDTMLEGGFYRASTILVTGFPGTAKTTLAGAFIEAACERGEKSLFVSFDSDGAEIIRNLASVDIRLQRFVDAGILTLRSAQSLSGSGEIHLMRIRRWAHQHEATCIVIDPVSALAKAGDESTAYNIVERLIEWTKSSGITLLCTSLLHQAGQTMEGTPVQISTIADTWIHLSYVVQAGERNRGLSIVKSRGTGHSNQVRELVLSHEGVTLADAYTAGGEVLMGTLRWEKERANHVARVEIDAKSHLKRLTLQSEEAVIEARLKSMQMELEAKRAEMKTLRDLEAKRHDEDAQVLAHMQALRRIDL